jgi:hypothetical protein
VDRIQVKEARDNRKKRGGVDVLRDKLVTLDTSQSPITPWGFPVASFDAANIGHAPFVVSLKQLLLALLKAALSAGVNAA